VPRTAIFGATSYATATFAIAAVIDAVPVLPVVSIASHFTRVKPRPMPTSSVAFSLSASG